MKKPINDLISKMWKLYDEQLAEWETKMFPNEMHKEIRRLEKEKWLGFVFALYDMEQINYEEWCETREKIEKEFEERIEKNGN